MRVLTVSRLCKTDDYKRIDLVIEAVKQLEFVQLFIVGDGDDRPRLEALASGCERIEFLGHVLDRTKHDLYDWCDVFVLPSTKEGFGLVFVEAMQHGKPCIGANAGAAPEVIEDHLTGLAIEPDSLDELIRALRYMHDDHIQAVMGLAGLKRANKHFSYDRFKSRVKELLA